MDTPAAAMWATHPSPPEDPDPMRSNRRKACDLCFTKKIKCDMLKPDCSNCLLYHAKCRTTIMRRKANPPKAKAAAQAQLASTESTALEARLASIENQLHQVLGGVKASQNTSLDSPSSNDGSADINSGGSDSNRTAQDTSVVWTDPCSFDYADGGFFAPKAAAKLWLPPIQMILPIVDHYFTHFNSVIPLFNKSAFMRLIDNWRSDSEDKVTWAAIQIVLALGLRTPKPGSIDSGFDFMSMGHKCLMNAQSAAADLVMHSEDLLGIQAILGIVMLFQDSKDPTPASVMIGSAVRLAHRLQLQSRDAMQNFTEDEAQQRAHVFWIAYTLEKDICLRAKTPSVQIDADIDLPLPLRISPDGRGMIWTLDGRTQLNYHRTRLELAHIQGRVFDLLYSNRSMRVRGQERQQRVSRLQDMLDNWYSRIPSAFQIDNVATTIGLGEAVHMTKMYHCYLLAEVMTHGIYSHDADWVKRISAVSRIAIRDMATSRNKNRTANCAEDLHAPLPEGWVKCVEVSRGCMKLFQNVTPTESLIWQCCCAHFSALIIVLSHMLLYPSHSRVSVDQHFAAKGVKLLDDMLNIINDPSFSSLRTIVSELYDKANDAVVAVRQPGGYDANDVFQQFNNYFFDDTDPSQSFDFLPYDNDAAPLDLLGAGDMDGPFENFGTDDSTALPDGPQVTELPSFMM